MNRRFKALLFGMFVGFVLELPIVLNKIYLYWYILGIPFGCFLLIILLRLLNPDLYYVHAPFRNTKNKWFSLYCFVYSHHAFIFNDISEGQMQCETCGKIGEIGHDDGSTWFITSVP